MYEHNRWKIIIVLVVFMILMILENLIYADFFMPYYKLIPSSVRVIPISILLILYALHSVTNFIIIMLMTKVIYEYEDIKRIFIGAAVTSLFQIIINIPTILSFQSIFGTIDKTTVFQCFVEGSGLFLITLPFLFILSYFVIKYVFNMEEMKIFYSLSMAILLSPVYHYLIFYTPILEILGLSSYIFGI